MKLSEEIRSFESMLLRERGPIDIEYVRRFTRKAKKLEARIAELEADNRKLWKFVAEKWGLESEYGGRMETWCFYCDEYQDWGAGKPRTETHKPGCLHTVALALEVDDEVEES